MGRAQPTHPQLVLFSSKSQRNSGEPEIGERSFLHDPIDFLHVSSMILSTTDTLQGITVKEYVGVVTAEVVYGSNALRDFFAGIRDIIGGRTGAYERVFEKGQKDAMDELSKRAQRLGADAVIGIEIDTGTINLDESGVLLLITATGTAVKL